MSDLEAPPELRRRVLELLEEATQSPEQSLDRAQNLGSLEGWDSLGMVMFIGLVTQELGVELSVHDLRESHTADDLARRIAQCIAQGIEEERNG